MPCFVMTMVLIDEKVEIQIKHSDLNEDGLSTPKKADGSVQIY